MSSNTALAILQEQLILKAVRPWNSTALRDCRARACTSIQLNGAQYVTTGTSLALVGIRWHMECQSVTWCRLDVSACAQSLVDGCICSAWCRDSSSISHCGATVRHVTKPWVSRLQLGSC